jgi:hypothetical protein
MRTMNLKVMTMTGVLLLGAPLAARADVTKRDVEEMLNAQFSGPAIVQYIRANAPVLPLTCADLQDLRFQGANEQVILALLRNTPSGVVPPCDPVPGCAPAEVDPGCDDPGFACDPGWAPGWGCAGVPVYPSWGGRWDGDHRRWAPGWDPRREGRRAPWLRGPGASRRGPGRPGVFRGSPSGRYPTRQYARGGAFQRPPRHSPVAHSVPAIRRTSARPVARAYRSVRRGPAVHRSSARPTNHGGGGHPAARGGSSHGSRRR